MATVFNDADVDAAYKVIRDDLRALMPTIQEPETQAQATALLKFGAGGLLFMHQQRYLSTVAEHEAHREELQRTAVIKEAQRPKLKGLLGKTAAPSEKDEPDTQQLPKVNPTTWISYPPTGKLSPPKEE